MKPSDIDSTLEFDDTNQLAPARSRRLGLRRRILLMFLLGALGLSVVFAFVTYGFTRTSLVQQRDQSARESARRNAIQAVGSLRAAPTSAGPTILQLTDLGVHTPVLWYNSDFAAGNPSYSEDQIPDSLIKTVIGDRTAARMITTIDGEPNIVVGFPLPNSDAAYFEFFSMSDVAETLGSVRLSLLLGTATTTTLAAFAGSLAARRAVRPVKVAAQAAKAIASGRLVTRLEPTSDPDLSVLARSFNDMATALQNRIERDTRFASDVSHELRSPLTTLSASVDVMDARRDEMPPRAQAALDLLKSDVIRFRGLVEDLLEISRFDAGAVRLHIEELLAVEFVRNAVGVSSLPDTPISATPVAEHLLIEGDRRRLARAIANLIDNARLHGGGNAEVAITESGSTADGDLRVRIAVEDHGTGVPLDERQLIFERFARGGVAGRRASSDGAGLGLALVDEHVRLHGGRLWVEDRLDGTSGARFVIELNAEEIDL
ncbi:MAG: two-component sensor histidine kinase [Ilumatobacter coccineus]|uniref:histidine kinase n=1 Tax=Ilumatobacter coccineus TaxID=467094 RepID=A0A2G6K9I5_9ACTN|nr:MAG: two-component sensor histidine kinase [Ilumatobacter coccineus]